jgi:hypothetical protein
MVPGVGVGVVSSIQAQASSHQDLHIRLLWEPEGLVAQIQSVVLRALVAVQAWVHYSPLWVVEVAGTKNLQGLPEHLVAEVGMPVLMQGGLALRVTLVELGVLMRAAAVVVLVGQGQMLETVLAVMVVLE